MSLIRMRLAFAAVVALGSTSAQSFAVGLSPPAAADRPLANAPVLPLPAGALARIGPPSLYKPGAVFAVAFSPDGKFLAWATEENKFT